MEKKVSPEEVQPDAAKFVEEIRREGIHDFRKWTVENAWDFPDKELKFGAVIIDSEHGPVLTEKGIMQLTGSGKIGKSTLLFNLVYGFVLGRDILSFKVNRPFRILYLNGENSGRTLQDRFRQLRNYFSVDEKSRKLIQENFLFVSVRLLLPKMESLKALRENISEIQPEIVIIDPLKNFFDGEENSADDVRKFMQAIRQIIDELNITVILVHHTGKKQNENDLYSGRGSSVLADDAEVTAAFSRDVSNKGRFNLSVIGRNCEEFSLHLMRDADTPYLFCETNRPKLKPAHSTLAILEALPQKFSTKVFIAEAKKKELSESTAKRRLEDCVTEFQLVKKVRRGEYEKCH